MIIEVPLHERPAATNLVLRACFLYPIQSMYLPDDNNAPRRCSVDAHSGTHEPDIIIPFGKHKGTAFRSLPDIYLEWMIRHFDSREWRDLAVSEYERRHGILVGETKEARGEGPGPGDSLSYELNREYQEFMETIL